MKTNLFSKPIFKEELTTRIFNSLFDKIPSIEFVNGKITTKELLEKAKQGDEKAIYALSITIANLRLELNDDFDVLDRCSDLAVLLGEEVYKAKKEYGLSALGNAYRSYQANYVYNKETGEWDENIALERERTLKSFNYFKELYYLTNTYEALIDWMKISTLIFYDETDVWKEPASETKEAVDEENCPAELIAIYGEELIIGRMYPQNINLGAEYLDKAIAMGSERAESAKVRLLDKYKKNKNDSFSAQLRKSYENKPNNAVGESQGCYIATCAYGSYNCPEVWVLRRYRDYYLDNHWWGKLFIKIYYKLSPKFVARCGDNTKLKEKIRSVLDKKIKTLKSKGYSDLPYDDKY